MLKKLLHLSVAFGVLALVTACDQKVANDPVVDVRKVHVDHLSPDMEKVRDYVPNLAVVAHRGSTFWVPEETEAAYRWARDMGADYLEADLQISKDGVILALHDDNLKRTTDIENVFGESFPEKARTEYYTKLGYDAAKIKELIAADKKSFLPNYTTSYTYYELMMLDAGTWFNETSVEQARPSFSAQFQYISALEDMVRYSKGGKLKRDGNGKRIYNMALTAEDVKTLYGGISKVVNYNFEYEADAKATQHVPGIYLEFKESWLNPSDFEARVSKELTRLDMNIITKPATETANYKSGYVNVGNTNGKVILQTFSLESLRRSGDIFEGKIPMCFLLWKGTGATDLHDASPLGYASFINLAVKNKAHIIGPCIAGAPNNYPELNEPWMDWLIGEAGLLNHPYSFDSHDQMAKNFGDYNFGITSDRLFEPPYMDGLFTNRTELTMSFFRDRNARGNEAPEMVHGIADPTEVLVTLGY